MSKHWFALLLIVVLISIPFPVVAGGLYLREAATPSMGTASAGDQAWAHDASTAFHNPAGMTLLDGDQFMVGAGIVSSTVEFDPAEFTEESNEGFDPVYMGKLYELGYQMASNGYPWVHAPPGFILGE